MYSDRSDSDIYNDTVSESIEESITKALIIMEEEKKRIIEEKKKILYRPKVSLFKGLIPITLYITAIIFFIVYSDEISKIIGIKKEILSILFLVFILLLLLLSLKPLIIWMILVYQRYAPERIRISCVYEPSCSNYMMIAIKKYGVFKGVKKGINRLLRCHPPNGGVDEP